MKFLDPNVIAQLKKFRFAPRFAQIGSFIGHRHHRLLKGSSSEFVDFRNYTQGDDLRRVDWKVYGRTDRYYLRIQEGEANCTVWIILDGSASMTFRSAPSIATKWEMACKAAIGLVYLALNSQDNCGLALFADKPLERVAPRANWEVFYQTIELLEHFSSFGEQTKYADAFPLLLEPISRRSLLVVISDFLGDSAEGLATSLSALTLSRHEVIALRILDPAEVELSLAPMYTDTIRFLNIENEPPKELDVPWSQIQKVYQERFQQEEKHLETLLSKKRISFVRLRTDQDLGSSLIRALNEAEVLAPRL